MHNRVPMPKLIILIAALLALGTHHRVRRLGGYGGPSRCGGCGHVTGRRRTSCYISGRPAARGNVAGSRAATNAHIAGIDPARSYRGCAGVQPNFHTIARRRL